METKPEIIEGKDQVSQAPVVIGRHRIQWNDPKLLQTLLVVGLFLLTLTLNVSRAVRAGYNHDEDQFIASARLLLDEGLLPYRDFPYFHTPYLVFVYALLFKLTGSYNLLAARLFSAVCATGCVMLVFGMTLYFFRKHAWGTRYLAATGILFFYLANPLSAFTVSLSWNHSFSVLLMLASNCLLIFGAQKKSPGAWFFAAGALLGMAMGVRVSSLTLLPAIFIALIWLPGGFSWPRFIRLSLLFLAGFALALLPLLWMYIIAPQQFVFGNLGYARLNATYRVDIPVAYDGNLPVYGPMSLAEKLGFLWNEVIGQPANLLLFVCLVFFGWSVLLTRLRRKDEESFGNVLLLAAAPMALMGSFLPSPSWYQYFYVAVPFALLAVALGLSYLIRDSGGVGKWFQLLFILLVIIATLYGLLEYKRMGFLRYVELWKPLVMHDVGMELRDQVGPDGQVFTLAPLYPLEGGLDVVSPLATGVFAYRTGSLLDAEQRGEYGIISAENLAAYLDEDLPEGILVGFDPLLEEEIVAFAAGRGYLPQPLDGGLTLWVRPDLGPP